MRTIFILLPILLAVFSCNDENNSSPECICPLIFDPVCGSDGNVFSNSCLAECAGVEFTSCEVAVEALIINTGLVAADGCGWVVQINGENHHPLTLDEGFQQDELEVTVTFISKPEEQFFCGLFSTSLPIIEIIDISER